MNKFIRGYLREIGHLGGSARAKKLTPKRRKEIATKAANARWNNRQLFSGWRGEELLK